MQDFVSNTKDSSSVNTDSRYITLEYKSSNVTSPIISSDEIGEIVRLFLAGLGKIENLGPSFSSVDVTGSSATSMRHCFPSAPGYDTNNVSWAGI
jgi:hypothetical protein